MDPPVGNEQSQSKKIATPAVSTHGKSSQNDDRSSRVEFTSTFNCVVCDKTNEELQWFVMCDDCDNHFHFSCVGISDIRAEDPWSCEDCQNKASKDMADQIIDNSATDQINTATVVNAVIHEIINSNDESLELSKHDVDIVSNQLSSTLKCIPENQQRVGRATAALIPDIDDVVRIEETNENREVTVDNARIEDKSRDVNRDQSKRSVTQDGKSSSSKTRSTSSKTRTGSSKSRSTSSTQRRLDMELQRVQDELNLQANIDEERLALKLVAVKLKAEAIKHKEIREKKFLEAKYKAMALQTGSVRSHTTQITTRSELVTNWIEDQRKQVKARSLDNNLGRYFDKNEKTNFDISIPISDEERKMLGRPRITDIPTLPKAQDLNVAAIPSAQPMVSENGKLNASAQVFMPNSNQADPLSNQIQSKPGFRYSQNQPPVVSVANQVRSKPAEIGERTMNKASKINPTFSNCASWPNSIYTQNCQPIVSMQNRQSNFMTQNCQPIVSMQNRQSNFTTQNCQPIVSMQKRQPSVSTMNTTYDINDPSIQYETRRNPSYQQSRKTIDSTINPRDDKHVQWTNPMQSTQLPEYRSYSDPRCTLNEESFFYTVESGSQSMPPTRSGYHQTIQPPYQESRLDGIREPDDILSQVTTSNVDQPGYTRSTLTASQIAARHAVPKNLPKFNGNSGAWLRFNERYENSTRMCGYSNDENLERLDNCLEGQARDIVESLLTYPNCVPEIMATLKQKYGRPENIVKAALSEIRKEPPIKSYKLETLSNYGYKVRNVCKTIEGQKLHYYLYNPELVHELVEKLPLQTKVDWARYSEELTQVTLVTLSNWLYKLSQSLNRITTPEIYTNSNEHKQERKPERKSDSPKTGYINVHNVHKSSQEKSKCVVCTKGCKTVGECQEFKSMVIKDRWKASMDHKLCRTCLNKHRRPCRASKACGINGCEYKHHPLLHDEPKHSREHQRQPARSSMVKDNKATPHTETTTNKISAGNCNMHIPFNQEELFRIVPVTLYNNDRIVKTFAFLDEGSSFTLMERKLAEELHLKGMPEAICLIWTNKVHRQEQSERVNLEISGTGETMVRYPLRSVNLVDDLDLPAQSVSPKDLEERYNHLRGLPLDKLVNATPRILIGLKHVRLTTPLETIEGEENELIATRSRLGWSVCGPMNDNKTTGYVNVHHVKKCPCENRDEDIHKIVKDHFSIENFGVRANSMCTESKDDEKATKMLQKYTVRKGCRFETRLLWKNDSYIMPDSYGMAYKRLNCLENKGPAVVKIINDTIEDYLNKGYVSKLTLAEAGMKQPRTSYLPIFVVTNPKKPGKIRPVFDAAAKVKGVSLNSVLLRGPDLLSPIVDILRRFRENRIAVSGDIKEMYLQIMINKEDRDSQRFLWRSGEKDREPDVYVMNVMTFGATCSPSAAQYVKNKNASEYQESYPRAAKAIIENHYVDDMMDGADNVEDAVKLVEDVKFIHSKAGFEIRNFISNSGKVLKAIGGSTDVYKKSLIEDELKTERVLGMFWDTKLDCFTFSLQFTKVTSEILTGKKLPTKRELLKLIASIFDPLGLLSYYLIHAKILLQDVWRSEIGWDDQLPENLRENWDRWINLLPMVENLKIPRWYSRKLSPSTFKTNEVHVFVDAGGEAYSAVAYLRTEDETGCDSSLIGSKARVTPLKYMSTPRKELMGGILGSRLINSICDGLSIKIDRRVIWTDSRTLLIWLRSEHRKYSQFVGHRIGEILENTNLDEWRWVPSKLNVADEATKWSKKPTFECSDRWFTGPVYLRLPESEWPVQDAIVPNGTLEEMRLSCTHSQLILPSIINPSNTSKWERMHRGLAYAIRASKMFVARCRKLKIPDGPLTQEELIEAERKLVLQAQWEGFPEEMVTLVRNRDMDPKRQLSIDKDSSIKDCLPYLDEFGILRVSGRTDSAAAVTLEAKRPMILPKKHPITRLIVDSYHRRFRHQNHETVINELRQRFHIPQTRTVLKAVRWNCKLCAIRRCKPCPPMMADLPAIRFETGIRPFTYTGVDYFGPMFVKVGRSQHKRWGVLFTCLTVRAIHIEIAHSLDTQSCIMSIGDFINIRGRPIHFYSDQGTHFKGADNALKEELKKLDEQLLNIEFTSRYTKWMFNPPASPHMGGCWERLIRTVKSCLKESMTTRTPDDQTLRNLLMEAANIVNSRPLTFIPLESESAESLTPNHFIFGTSNGLKPPGKFRSDGPYLRDAWKEVQRCANIFWERFIKEYVPTLTRRTKWLDSAKPLEVGDLVIDFDETAFRNTYTRARVVETVIGTRGQVRRAKIQKANGSTLWRPATNLGVLDINNSAPTDGSLDQQPCMFETGGRSVGAQNSNLNSDQDYTCNQTSSKPKSSMSRVTALRKNGISSKRHNKSN